PGDAVHAGPVYRPRDGEVTALCPYASERDVDRALTAAHHAAQTWSQTPISARTEVLRRFASLLRGASQEIVTRISDETGKTDAEARRELDDGLRALVSACRAAQLLKSRHAQRWGSELDCFSLRRPLGVVAGITPFSYPLLLPLSMYPLALVCGNSFILKPS